ncbi:MAG: translation initiation factor IF-2 [Mycoplasmatales bacterium]|nr:translation initiation factor IF-2 [Mycoplasmatales bacterium]
MQDKRKLNKKEIQDQLTNVSTELVDGVFVFTGPMAIVDFAEKVKKPVNEIIRKYLMKGKMYNINHTLDEEEIAELCLEYGYDFQKENRIDAQNFMEEVILEENENDLVERAPIITIMGHVDHGKTTLIDKIRGTHVTQGEAGGITQHTGAYQVKFREKHITFLDTPGHEAFTAMRSRGAKVTDIVVLVVAADDGVMPQTKEAIAHAKVARVPIIVFVNKMDRPNVDIEKIKAALSQEDITSEEWGGETQFVYGSGLTGEGIDKLFASILLQTEMLELKSNPNRLPIGIVIESRLDKGKGSVTTLIVEHGTLMPRDFIVAGSKYGKIRTLQDTNGKNISEAIPGTPVVITGLNYSPNAGDKFFAFKDEKFAKNLAQEKAFADKQQDLRSRSVVEVREGQSIVNIVIKADVQGTSEAAKYSLAKLENEEIKINVVRSAVGEISKSDVLLAQASNAIIYGFNINPSGDVMNFAKENRVEIKTYNVIYKMIEDVEKMITGMKSIKYKEELTGRAQILKVFFYSKVGNIAGSKMETGFMNAGAKVKLYRNEKLIHEGKIDSLQRGPNALKKADTGTEFGTHIHKFENIKVGDIIEAYHDVEIKE